MSKQEKVRENVARKRAARRGWILTKCRRRDPHAIGYGLWSLVDSADGEHVEARGHIARQADPMGGPHILTLEDVEELLRGGS